MTRRDTTRALSLYAELHSLLLRASRLPVSDMERWRLSLRYLELKRQLKEMAQ
jgi:hypothetical protein